jgi:hypothetical protein
MNKAITNFFKRLYNLRLWSGLIISLPAMLACTWYSFNSYDYIKSYKNKELLNIEIFHVVLHDLLTQDKYKIFRDKKEIILNIPKFELKMKKAKFDKLLKEKDSYVSSKIRFDGKKHDIRIKLTGKQTWNYLENKKSLKIKTENNKSIIDNKHEIDLINPSNPMIIGEELYSDLSRQLGLLTPENSFAYLEIKQVNMGLYQYKTEADEIFLRNNKRILGNIYSFSKSKNSNLSYWLKKENWKVNSPVNDASFTKLEELLSRISSSKGNEFLNYADKNIDIDKFALLEAIDIIFGNDEYQSFDLFFDPYKVKWEPIVSYFDGFKHEEKINIVQNPLLEKLKILPEYIQLRNFYILKLIDKENVLNKTKINGLNIIENLKPILANDSNWKSNKLLPKLNSSYRQLMRPMTLEKLELVFNSEIETLNKRISYLKNNIRVNKNISNKTKIKNIVLGSGNIEVKNTKIFDKNTIVKILPKTTFIMLKDTSLIFLGQVKFEGTNKEPIIIKSKNNDKWGGLVLQGKETKNSYIKNVILSGGSFAKWNNNNYSGMINIHDTNNIFIDNSYFQNNAKSDDLVHIAYVNNIKISNSTFKKAFSDSLDLEYSNGELANLKINKSGDDGIDLMGSILDIKNTVILSSKNNGISSGEESNIKIEDSLIYNSKVGILTKNASNTKIERSLIYKNNIGIELNQKTLHYENESHFKAKLSFVYKNQKDTKETDGYNSLEKKGLHSKLKKTSLLNNLLNNTLNIKNLDELDNWITKEENL